MEYLDPTKTSYVAGQSKQEQAGQRVWQVVGGRRSLPVEVAGALAAQEGSQERSGPVSRAVGLVIRLMPITGVWALLSLFAGILGLGEAGSVFLFATLTAITYLYADRQEYRYSRNGLERHRIDQAVALATTQMEQDHELRRTALSAFIQYLEQRHD